MEYQDNVHIFSIINIILKWIHPFQFPRYSKRRKREREKKISRAEFHVSSVDWAERSYPNIQNGAPLIHACARWKKLSQRLKKLRSGAMYWVSGGQVRDHRVTLYQTSRSSLWPARAPCPRSTTRVRTYFYIKLIKSTPGRPRPRK